MSTPELACDAGTPALPKMTSNYSIYKLFEVFFGSVDMSDVQRVVDGEVDLRRTSTSELACDAGTSGTLSAGDLGRLCELAHLHFSWCAAESLRELQILRPLFVPLLRSATFEFSARK